MAWGNEADWTGTQRNDDRDIYFEDRCRHAEYLAEADRERRDETTERPAEGRAYTDHELADLGYYHRTQVGPREWHFVRTGAPWPREASA